MTEPCHPSGTAPTPSSTAPPSGSGLPSSLASSGVPCSAGSDAAESARVEAERRAADLVRNDPDNPRVLAARERVQERHAESVCHHSIVQDDCPACLAGVAHRAPHAETVLVDSGLYRLRRGRTKWALDRWIEPDGVWVFVDDFASKLEARRHIEAVRLDGEVRVNE